MSIYTTGELAKLCGVSVRTVQYYDTRGILVPSALSEGGRRLYSEEDVRRLKIICFLRELDLSIDNIHRLLAEDEPEAVIAVLLEEQHKTLEREIAARQEKLRLVSGLQNELRHLEHFTVDSIGDIAHIMENRKKLWRLMLCLLPGAFAIEAAEIATLMLWIFTGCPLPYLLATLAAVVFGIAIITVYWRRAAYICPLCHGVFSPGYWQFFFAAHTPRTRKLTCPDCGWHGYCIETCKEKEQTNESEDNSHA